MPGARSGIFEKSPRPAACGRVVETERAVVRTDRVEFPRGQPRQSASWCGAGRSGGEHHELRRVEPAAPYSWSERHR